MRSAHLKLILNSPEGKIPLQSFSAAINKIRAVLQEIDRYASRGEGINIWAVTRLSMSSPAQVSIEPLEAKEKLDPMKSVNLTVQGFLALNEKPKRPEGFSDIALKRAREFARLKDIKTIDDIRLENGNLSVSLTGYIVPHVDELIGAPPKESTGSIQGKLDLIDVHTGLQVGIYRKLDSLYVKAIFEEEGEEIRRKIISFLGKPVLAIGEVKRNKAGDPKEIKIHDIKALPKASTLESLYGSDPTFTNGLDVDEFLRRQRDE